MLENHEPGHNGLHCLQNGTGKSFILKARGGFPKARRRNGLEAQTAKSQCHIRRHSAFIVLAKVTTELFNLRSELARGT
jgi:hypothetical protein